MERWILRMFWVIYSTVFMLLTMKAFTVPITHDEGWTVIQYVDHSVWDIMMYPDAWPNNHILNTLLAKLSASIFGVHDWSVRLPNLLFFWVYAFGVFRFLKAVFKERMVLFLPAATVFVLSPYFLDFFALCRGYGISSALTMLSVSYFVTGFKRIREAHVWMAFCLALIASYANFTVLVFLASAFGMALLYFILYRKNGLDFIKNATALFVITLGYAVLIYTPIAKMKATNQFEFWTSNGFFEETIFSVIHNSLSDSGVYTRPEWFAVLVVLISLVLWGYVAFRLVLSKFEKSTFASSLAVTAMLLFGCVAVSLVQTTLLGDPNLNGRTALFLLPVFTSLAVTGFLFLPKRRLLSWGVGGGLILVTFQHVAVSYRSDSFKEWRYDKYTLEVISALEKQEGRQLLRVDWLYQNSFEFYAKYERSDLWGLQVNNTNLKVDPHANVDYYYVPKESVGILLDRFEVVKTFAEGQTLMRRK